MKEVGLRALMGFPFKVPSRDTVSKGYYKGSTRV